MESVPLRSGSCRSTRGQDTASARPRRAAPRLLQPLMLLSRSSNRVVTSGACLAHAHAASVCLASRCLQSQWLRFSRHYTHLRTVIARATASNELFEPFAQAKRETEPRKHRELAGNARRTHTGTGIDDLRDTLAGRRRRDGGGGLWNSQTGICGARQWQSYRRRGAARRGAASPSEHVGANNAGKECHVLNTSTVPEPEQKRTVRVQQFQPVSRRPLASRSAVRCETGARLRLYAFRCSSRRRQRAGWRAPFTSASE